jgi:hypothetical protein
VSIDCDPAEFDFASVGPIAFALLDVDLYVPMAAILPKLYENLSPGGMILVDDCMPHAHWDARWRRMRSSFQERDCAPDHAQQARCHRRALRLHIAMAARREEPTGLLPPDGFAAGDVRRCAWTRRGVARCSGVDQTKSLRLPAADQRTCTAGAVRR